MSRHQATSDVAKRHHGQVVCSLRIPSLQKKPAQIGSSFIHFPFQSFS